MGVFIAVAGSADRLALCESDHRRARIEQGTALMDPLLQPVNRRLRGAHLSGDARLRPAGGNESNNGVLGSHGDRRLYANELKGKQCIALNVLGGLPNDSFMNIAANLSALMAAEPPVSENRLHRETGVPQPTIHRIMKGQSIDPRDGTLRPIATYFGVTVEQLRTCSTEQILALRKAPPPEKVRAYDVRAIAEETEIDSDREVLVDVVDIRASGGPGSIVPEFVETKFRMPFQLSWFRQIGAKPENVKVMRVNGHSMERTLFDGDRIAVNLADTRIVDGHVYVFATSGPDGGAKVKRLYVTTDGRLRIVSDNADKAQYPDEYVSPDEMDNIQMIGRVVDRSGRGGL